LADFQEYPKHVYPDSPTGKYEDSESRKGVLVLNAEEEEAAMAGQAVVRDDEIRRRMMKIVEMNALTVDGRWGLARIAEAIRAAGLDPDLNPFE
jgi:hypothetical protein